MDYKVTLDGQTFTPVIGWKYYNGTDLTDATVERMPFGYPTVGDMLSKSPFYVAHRGGSLDWPEHSLLAYTQAVWAGYPALELALARTSDGVWFGLHDDSINRTSGTTGLPDASQMTWDEVRQYVINLPAGTSGRLPQPYMRWEEYVAAYYSTHVTFIDVKAAFDYRTELLNMMDALPGNPRQRFVVKYYGKQYEGWGRDAHDRGYKTWGYFYAGDGATIDQWSDKWDILGLSYDAPDADWASFRATGKPIIGHICPDQAAVDQALAQGAAGVMVSGVAEVPPVAPEQAGPTLYDTFADVADGNVPVAADTGQAWGIFEGPGVVTGGYFDSVPGNGAVYLEAEVGEPITSIGAKWRFDDGGDSEATSSTLALITWADGGMVANGYGRRTSCHVTITRWFCQWYVRDTENGGAVTLVDTANFSPALPANTLHEANISIGVGTGTVTVNGTDYTFTDERIVRYEGERFANFEPYYGAEETDTRTQIAEVWADA